MEKEAARILRKKRPTGEELGRLYIAEASRDVRNFYLPNRIPALYDEDQYIDVVGLLEKQEDTDHLEFCVHVTSCFERLANESMKYDAAFLDGVNRLIMRLHVVYSAEISEAQSTQAPLTMTEAEYEALKNKARANLESRKTIIDEVVLDILVAAFSESLKTSAALPDSVLNEIEALRKIPEENEDVKVKYKFGAFNGLHRILATGELVERRELVEWLRQWRRSRIGSNEFFNLTKAFYHGKKVSKDIFKDYPVLIDLLNKEEKFFFYVLEEYLGFRDVSMLGNIIEKNLDVYLSGGQKLSSFEKLSDNAVTKYDVLATICGSDQYTPSILTEYFYPDKEKGAAQAIKQEFPNVWEAIEQYIKEAHPSNKYTWGSLAAAGIKVYNFLLSPTASSLADNYDASNYWGHKQRILNRGIAVIKEETLTEAGKYEDALMPSRFSLYRGINHVDDEELERIAGAYSHVAQGAKRILDTAVVFNVLSDLFNAPVLQWATNRELVERSIKNINTAVYSSYLGMQGSEEAKRAKRKKYKKIFKDFDIAALEPKEKIIRQWRRKLKNGIKEKDHDIFIDDIDQFTIDLYNKWQNGQ